MASVVANVDDIWIAHDISRTRSFSLLLSGCNDEVWEGLFHVLSSSMGTEFSSSKLSSSLFLGGNTSSNQFEHSLFKWWMSRNLMDDLSDESASLGLVTSSQCWSRFPSLFGWSSDQMAVIQAHSNVTSTVSLTHVFNNPIVNNNNRHSIFPQLKTPSFSKINQID